MGGMISSNHNQYGYGQPQERHPLWDDVLHIGGYLGESPPTNIPPTFSG